MTLRQTTILSALTLVGLFGTADLVSAAGRRPVVVELFTSQGCSSCPPANANLVELLGRSDVLALSFSVTYWDRLGWKDVFGRPEFTARQYAYEPALGQSGPFTPQIVVDGRRTTVGNRLSDILDLIAEGGTDGGPAVDLAGGRVTIGKAPAPAAGTDVWLVRYEPEILQVAVERGENRGRTLPHAHVVRELTHLGAWSGAAATFALPKRPEGLATAVLVQVRDGGPILAAATN